MVTKKCSPFALQKSPFCVVKGPLLECKRTTFGVQKDYFCKQSFLCYPQREAPQFLQMRQPS